MANTLKWTKTKVIAKLNECIDILKADPKIFTVTEAAERAGIYPKFFKRMYSVHKNDDNIIDLLDRLYGICENRIVEAGLTGVTNPTFSMFILKANFGYVEQQHIIQTNTNKQDGDINVNVKYLNDKA